MTQDLPLHRYFTGAWLSSGGVLNPFHFVFFNHKHELDYKITEKSKSFFVFLLWKSQCHVPATCLCSFAATNYYIHPYVCYSQQKYCLIVRQPYNKTICVSKVSISLTKTQTMHNVRSHWILGVRDVASKLYHDSSRKWHFWWHRRKILSILLVIAACREQLLLVQTKWREFSILFFLKGKSKNITA